MIRNGKPIDHSNVGGLWGSLIAWLVAMAAFVGSLYAMGFWSLDRVWIPGIIALALATIAYMIPKAFLGRSDTVDTMAIHTMNPAGLHAGSHVHPGSHGALAQDRH